MADFPQHEAPERKKPLSGRKNGVQRETYRKAKQADRRHAHEQERMMTRQINEGRWQDDQG